MLYTRKVGFVLKSFYLFCRFDHQERAGDDLQDYEAEIRAEQRKKNEAKRKAKKDKEAAAAKKAAFAKRAGAFGQ